MLHHPIPTWDSKLDGTRRSNARPPCFPLRRPALCLQLSFAVQAPFQGLNPPSRQSLSLSFFYSSLGWGASRLWEEEGEGEVQEEAGILRCPQGLPLSLRRSRNPFFLLSNSISSSSSESLSTHATTRLGEQAMECLSNSPLESKKWIINSLCSSLSSLRWN